MSKLNWNDPAAGQVPEKYKPVPHETLRMFVRWLCQDRGREKVAAELGCTEAELRRETAVGWTAPLEDEIARLACDLAAAQAQVSRVREALDAASGARGSADYRDGINTTVLNIRAALDGGGEAR